MFTYIFNKNHIFKGLRRYPFSTSQQLDRSEFKRVIVDHKVMRQQKAEEKQLKQLGWVINLKDDELVLENKVQGYNLKVLTAPTRFIEEFKVKSMKMLIDKQEFNKKLVAQYFVKNNHIHIEYINFINMEGNEQSIGYEGPDLKDLPKDLQSSLFQYLQAIGLTETTLFNIYDINTNYEKQLYNQWLHKFSSLIE